MESFPHRFFLKSRYSAHAGFTLIEMLVVLGIIVIITSIALSSQSGFNRTLALNNAAYDIALSVEQAQSLGLSSQAFGGVGNAGYGVAFSTGSQVSYTLFADTYPNAGVSGNCHCSDSACAAFPDAKPGNCEYDSTHAETVQTYTLNNGFKLGKMCVYPSSGAHVCSTDGTPLTDVAISFTRPNTQTFIAGKKSSWNTSYTGACFTLTSPQGDTRYISVSQTGQVALTTTVCN